MSGKIPVDDMTAGPGRPVMHIELDADGCWPDMQQAHLEGRVIETNEISVAALQSGMQSGGTSVAFRINLPDGRIVFAQTSLKLYMLAAELFRQRYGKE